jgi:hypothetical protein
MVSNNAILYFILEKETTIIFIHGIIFFRFHFLFNCFFYTLEDLKSHLSIKNKTNKITLYD